MAFNKTGSPPAVLTEKIIPFELVKTPKDTNEKTSAADDMKFIRKKPIKGSSNV